MKYAIAQMTLACMLGASTTPAIATDGCMRRAESDIARALPGASDPHASAGGVTTDHAAACLTDFAKKSLAIDTVQIVDLRPADAAARHTIPGALRVPAGALVASPFLDGTRPILLIGEQDTVPDLVRHCSTLRAAGYAMTHVQRGGAAAWFARHAPTDPDSLARSSAASIVDAEITLRLLRWPHTLVLVSKDDVLPEGTRAARLHDDADDAALTDRARSAGVLLLIGDRTIPDATLARVQRLTGLPPIVYTQGTDVLHAFRARQTRVQHAAQTSLTQDCRWN